MRLLPFTAAEVFAMTDVWKLLFVTVYLQLTAIRPGRVASALDTTISHVPGRW